MQVFPARFALALPAAPCLLAVCSGAPASAAPARQVPVGPATLVQLYFISGESGRPLVVGPETAILRILLPKIVGSFSFAKATYTVSGSGEPFDGPAFAGIRRDSVPLPAVTSTVTIPWSPGSQAWPTPSDASFGMQLDVDTSAAGQGKKSQLRLNMIALRRDPAATGSTATLDLRTPAKDSARLSFSYEKNTGSPATVRRGQRVTFTTQQDGLFIRGPLATTTSSRRGAIAARYSRCTNGGSCDEERSLPVTVSPDGRKATVTLKTNLAPMPRHNASETLQLSAQFSDGSSWTIYPEASLR